MGGKYYAVKIGEVRIRARHAITQDDRERVLKLLRKRSNAPVLYDTDGLEVIIVTHPEGEHG